MKRDSNNTEAFVSGVLTLIVFLAIVQVLGIVAGAGFVAFYVGVAQYRYYQIRKGAAA